MRNCPLRAAFRGVSTCLTLAGFTAGLILGDVETSRAETATNNPAPSAVAVAGASGGANATALEALRRLRGLDLETNPSLRAAVLRVLETTRGTPAFVELVREFRLSGQEDGLLEVAGRLPGDAAGADAVRLLLQGGQADRIRIRIQEAPAGLRGALVEALANSGDRLAVPLLIESMRDTRLPVPVRAGAVRALARSEAGATALLEAGGQGGVDESLRMSAALALAQARWPVVRQEAARVFPLPRSADGQALPSLPELLARTGDAGRGARAFRTERAGCIKCHRVGDDGVDFGPALSQIGTKLGRQALFEAILDPSAGISFGFEGCDLELRNGDELSGIVVSETADDLTLKQPSGVGVRVRKADLVHRTPLTLSLMPAGLGQLLSPEELVDVVEYLTTLRAP